MKLAYESQLQEDYKGMKDENHFLTTVYVPCREMMEMFEWHTAERGIISDAKGKTVAINRAIPGDPLHALLVLRSKLDAYLEAKNKVLFWCLIGEKQLGNVPYAHLERLTGAAAYRMGEEIDVMQPLRNEPPAPQKERRTKQPADYSKMPEGRFEELLKALSEDISDEDEE